MLTRSYVHGASQTPLIGETIGAAFDRAVDRWGEREALVVPFQSIRWTYRELRQQADAFAAGLLAMGLAPGDRIGIWSPNNAEWVVTQLAAAKAGLILVNINPAYRGSGITLDLAPKPPNQDIDTSVIRFDVSSDDRQPQMIARKHSSWSSSKRRKEVEFGRGDCHVAARGIPEASPVDVEQKICELQWTGGHALGPRKGVRDL